MLNIENVGLKINKNCKYIFENLNTYLSVDA